jgi:hypothetical protein
MNLMVLKVKLSIILLLLLGQTMLAQTEFNWGAVGGVNAAKILTSSKTKPINGFHAGLITEFKFPKNFGIETDVLFSSKGTRIEVTNIAQQKERWEYKLSYIDVPVLAKLYFLKVFNLQVGPQASYLMSADYNGTNVKDQLNTFDFGVVGGVGLDVWVLHTSLRYNYGLTDIDSKDGKNSVLQISLGLWVK